ncbi:hypothetical protein [Paenibacillus sp. YPG26]|uniref:hypothetical protein n=1 Tax=Paenibacillus sp. YPG26 TaxID=2878915 RepID=UPI00203B41FB|nr:hypothetical protein [Paenibacillus sp. YPG26]USB32539.1 hypothetical protein LDO05_14715 [Paenibacillus sp. YPG26]
MALKKRERRVPNGATRVEREYPAIGLEQAIDFVISAKRTEGLRERTLQDYTKHYGYFIILLREFYPDIEEVAAITTQIIRDHISYMK